MYKDPSTPTLELIKDVIKRYGLECVEWEPFVFKQTIEADTKTSISKINLLKICAGCSIINLDTYFNDWKTFQFLTQVLNNDIPSAVITPNFTVGELMVGVETAVRLRKSLKKLNPAPEFSEEIAKYIAAQALEDGIWYLPKPLDFANKYSSMKKVICKECGYEEFFDNQKVCSNCTEANTTSSLKDFKPKKHRVKKGFGKKIKIVEKNPTSKVSKKLTKLLINPKNEEIKVEPEDMCAVKLYSAISYMYEQIGVKYDH